MNSTFLSTFYAFPLKQSKNYQCRFNLLWGKIFNNVKNKLFYMIRYFKGNMYNCIA